MSKRKSTLQSNLGTHNIKMSRSISKHDIWEKFHKNVIGIDIETKTAALHRGEIFNIGLSHPSGNFFEINILQDKSFTPASLQHFHQQPNRMAPYLSGQISGVSPLDIRQRQSWQTIKDETGLKYRRSVMAKAEAQAYLSRTLKTDKYNIVGHNLNFERRKFKQWGLPNIVEGSSSYQALIRQNAIERKSDIAAFKSGKITASQVREADIARQMKVYELQIAEGLKGGVTIDSQEIAKSLFAMAKKRGLIKNKAALALGSNVELLTETLLSDITEVHRGVQDVAVQNKLLPRMIEYVEELKEGKVPKGLSKWLERWKDPESIKIQTTTKAIAQGIENLASKRSHTMFSGKLMVSTYSEMKDALTKTGKYSPAIITQGERIAEYSIPMEDIYKKAEEGLSEYHKGLLRKIESTAKASSKTEARMFSMASKMPKVFGAMILAGAAYTVGKFLYDRTTSSNTPLNQIYGKDDAYNYIEGLSHRGIAKQLRQKNTSFGSGYQDGISRFSMAMQDPYSSVKIQDQIDRSQNKTFVANRDFRKTDLMLINDQQTLEAINHKRKQLREVKLSEHKLLVDDADTIFLKRKDGSEGKITIRLGGIDTPETLHGKSEKGIPRWRQNQPYGEAATKRLKEILNNTDKVRLIVDPTQRTYGRYIGTLIGENGLIFKSNTNINLQLVKEGYASSLEFGSATRDIADRAMFMAAGSKAEKEEKGMWSSNFFKNWKIFSQAAGRDVTFNSFTSLLRLSKNKYLAKEARLMWEDKYSPEESYRYGSLYQITNQFSGKDGQYNTIEALPHKWFGLARKKNTDFGSGYQGPHTKQYEDPTPFAYSKALLASAAFGLSAYNWNKQVSLFGKKIDIDTLSYMGSSADKLGREYATYSDLVYNAVRRIEFSLGGLPKAFSISTIMSSNVYRDAIIDIDLAKQINVSKIAAIRKGYAPEVTFGYEKYLMSLTGLPKEKVNQYTGVRLEKGKLYGIVNGQKTDVILEHARAIKRIHDPRITESASQFAKSYESIFYSGGVGKEHEFLITGANDRFTAYGRMAHAYAHETVSKYLRLMNDPAKALRDLMPNIDSRVIRGAEKITRFIPSLGVAGGERGLVAPVGRLFGRHFMKAAPWLVGAPLAFSLVNSYIKSIFPEDSKLGKQGLIGVGAEVVKGAHYGYAYLSDITGMTDLNKQANEMVPGLVGVAPWIGFTASGFLTGAATGMAVGLGQEALSKAGKARYASMIASKTEKAGLGLLGKIFKFKGEYTRTVRWGLKGAIVSGILSLPFLIAGLGSSESLEEIKEEYSGEKEVAIRKARWWEMSSTPWSGGKIMYYRPNWYQRLYSDYKDKSLYGEDMSLIESGLRTFIDPYWLEKKHYKDRPYPIAGPSGEGLGIFGPAYEMTLGRIIKPPVEMHEGEWGHGKRGKRDTKVVAKELGESGPQDAVSPYSLSQELKNQYYKTYEALGLRGFVGSSIKQFFTGEQDLDTYTPVLASSSEMESIQRSYWDLNLGGLAGMTEPYRRLNPKKPYTTKEVNPIKNEMPSWMPGRNYFINFKVGDPYTKIQEGEYRLPGAGYATRYKELEGISPEDYPLIHRYKILADVAPYSSQFRKIRRQLESINPSEDEMKIFLETERQLKEKRKLREFKSEVYDQSAIGRYGAALTELYRKNPLEQLTPLAPAHKFLPPLDAISQYEESTYGKDFKLWQHPYEDFIKPAINVALKELGAEELPSEVKERRQIEEYFDQLKYIKYKKLEESARHQSKDKLAARYRRRAERTMTGMDLYGNLSHTISAIPKREKAFYPAFIEARGKERERIRKLLSSRMKEFYEAQWEKKDLLNLEKADLSEEEKTNIEKNIYNRITTRRALRKAEQKALEKSNAIPDDDWIGWRTDVDLDDVKLKYLITTGRDYHLYELWEDRVRTLGRKPFLEEAVEEINPLNPLSQDVTMSDVYLNAVRMGVVNPIVTTYSGGNSIKYDLEYDRDEEIRHHLKELDMVI